MFRSEVTTAALVSADSALVWWIPLSDQLYCYGRYRFNTYMSRSEVTTAALVSADSAASGSIGVSRLLPTNPKELNPIRQNI